MAMQTDDTNLNLANQTNEFLTYTADTDNDTIMAQVTIINGLVEQLAPTYTTQADTDKLALDTESNADYAYFLQVNTSNPQSIERKHYALEGLQEWARRLLNQLQSN